MRPEHSLGEVAVHLLCHGVTAETPGDVRIARSVQRGSGREDLVELLLNPRWRLQVVLRRGAQCRVRLRLEGEHSTLVLGDEAFPVEIDPRPEFIDGVTPSGTPRASLGRAFYNYLILHPLTLKPEGGERRLMINPPGEAEPRPLMFDDVLDLAGAALKSGQIDCVSLRWHQRLTPGEVDVAVGPLLRAIKRNFDVVIAGEGPAPLEPGALDLLYGEGADAISIPVYALTPEAPGRGASLDETLRALERAVAVFPRGTVLSPLMLGLEAPDATRLAITRLAGMGVCAGIDMRLLGDRWADLQRVWTIEEIALVWAHLEQEIEHARLSRPWTPHPMTETVAIPALAFDPSAPCEPMRGGFWQTRPGQLVVRNLIRLRRRLRVRRIDQSLESSEL